MIVLPPPPRIVYLTRHGGRLELWATTWLELIGCILVLCSFGWLNSDLRVFVRSDP